MIKKYITTDGKTCREVNPYLKPLQDDKYPDVLHNPKWYEFEATVKHYPLTQHYPSPTRSGLIGKDFFGEEVWQYKSLVDGLDWETDTKDVCLEYPLKRIAIEPIEKPLEGEEKAYDENGDLNVGVIGKQLEKDLANMPDNDFRFKQDEVWNSAIEKAISVLVGTEASAFPYHLVPFSESRERIIDILKKSRK